MGEQGTGNGATDLRNTLVDGVPEQSSRAPGGSPMPLGSTAPVQTAPGKEPPDFKAMGADTAKADFAAASAGGWQYDPEGMLKLIKELKATRAGKLADMEQRTEQLVGIDPPGAEMVSEDYTSVANASGGSHNTQFQGYRDYLDAYIDTLETIDRAYQEQDQAALDALRQKGA